MRFRSDHLLSPVYKKSFSPRQLSVQVPGLDLCIFTDLTEPRPIVQHPANCKHFSGQATLSWQPFECPIFFGKKRLPFQLPRQGTDFVLSRTYQGWLIINVSFSDAFKMWKAVLIFFGGTNFKRFISFIRCIFQWTEQS